MAAAAERNPHVEAESGRLAQSFSDQRSTLETQWEHSDKVSTEELRVAFRRCRSFFDRLLSI
ncbi:MAG TPA: hypothetical protein VNO43_04550 [Candidatus Eisenbacteria bacterium]|nr:hypothetical protein [Candidatus Eisenbacteria bacterium]